MMGQRTPPREWERDDSDDGENNDDDDDDDDHRAFGTKMKI